MYATNYLENAVLNAMCGITFRSPGTVYVGLFLSNPTETGSAGTEVSYKGYARQPISFSEPALSGVNMSILNTEQVTFPESDQSAGSVTYIGIMDSLVGGNMLAYGSLTEEMIVNSGYAPVILAGEAELYLAGAASNAFKKKILNIFRGMELAGFSPYFALFNGNPESGGAELEGSNYARVLLTLSAPAQSDSGQAYVTNTKAVNFNRPSAAWGTYGYAAIYNAASAGEPVWIQAISPSVEIKKGYMPMIAAGAVRVAIN